MSTQPQTTVERSRGMRDLLPTDMRAFRRVEDAFRAAASRWGYEEVRTPTIETYSLFTVAGALTPQMLSSVYSFLDWDGWSGERVVLRPDSTIPVARAAREAGVEVPARLYYVQNVFRFHATEEREEWQCGVEFLGAPARLGDLEVIALACETFDALGLRPMVRLSHVGVARALVQALGPADAAEARALTDQVVEGGLGVARHLAEDRPVVAAFLEVALQQGDAALLENLAAIAGETLPDVHAALEELADVTRALSAAGRDTVVDLGMPLDFEYYNGVVFEFTSGEERWGRGGRYTPHDWREGEPTSCGLGLEASRLAVHLAPTTRKRLCVAIVAEQPGDLVTALAAARALHRSGIAAMLAENPGEGEMGLCISAGRLVAHTPGGASELPTLDDVVGLLVQFK